MRNIVTPLLRAEKAFNHSQKRFSSSPQYILRDAALYADAARVLAVERDLFLKVSSVRLSGANRLRKGETDDGACSMESLSETKSVVIRWNCVQ